MKKSKQLLSLLLALMMCLSLVSVPVYAEGEGAGEQTYIVNQDFEGFTVDATLTTKDDFKQTPPTNKVLADGDGNKFVRLPFAGHSPASTGDGSTGNADKSIIMNNTKFSYEDSEFLVVEASYRWDRDDVAPRIEVQFQTMSGKDASGNNKSFNWISLFRINTSNDTIMGCGQLTGATGNIDSTKWNDVRLIINLKAGTYDTYVNGQLYATAGNLRPEGTEGNVEGGSGAHTGCSDFSIPAQQMIIAKLNKDAKTYSEDTGKDPYDVYVDLDNVRAYYPTNLLSVQHNGNIMNVMPGQELEFARADQTFLYAKIAKGEETPIVTLNSKLVIDGPGYVIDTYYADGEAYLNQPFDILKDITEFKAEYGFSGGYPPAGAFEFVKETNSETLVDNYYLKLPFKASTANANGTGADSFIDKNLLFNNKAVSYKDMPVVEFSADYYFSAGSQANIQAQLLNAGYEDATTGEAKTQSWVDLWYIHFGGEATGGIATNNGTRVTATEGQTLAEPKAGEWFTVSAIVNLVTGKYNVYLNGELYITDAALKADITKVSIMEKTFIPAKFNKLGQDYYLGVVSEYVADTYLCVDNAVLKDGPKVNVTLDGKKTQLVIDSEYDFQLPGKIFRDAVITYAIPEGAPAGTAAKVETINGSKATSMLITAEMEGAAIVVTYADALYQIEFEGSSYPKDAAIATGDVFKGVHTYQAIKAEGEGDAANQYIRIPFQGTALKSSGTNGTGNYDKAMTLKTPALSYTDTEKLVLSVDYRPHFYDLPKAEAGYEYDGEKASAPTFEAQFAKVEAKHADGTRANETYISLFKLNLQTGHLDMVGTLVENAAPLTMDQWNNIKIIMNLVTGTYDTYVNGDLYATEGYFAKGNDNSDWTEINILADSLIIGKTNKNVGAYRNDETTPIGTSEMSYVDVDDITLRYVKDINFTMNGMDRVIKEDQMLDLTKKDSELVLAIKKVGDKVEYITDLLVKPEEGMDIQTSYIRTLKTLAKAEFRLGTPDGVRFVSLAHEEDLRDLRFLDIYNEKSNPDGAIKEVKYGTIIAPADFLTEGEDFTMETLDAKGTNGYVKVYATPNQEYKYDGKVSEGVTVFAGSVTNIQEKNYTRDFIGRAFVEVILPDGSSIVHYGAWTNNAANISDLAEAALGSNKDASDLVKEFIGSFIVAG